MCDAFSSNRIFVWVLRIASLFFYQNIKISGTETFLDTLDLDFFGSAVFDEQTAVNQFL